MKWSATVALAGTLAATTPALAASTDWPSYNRTLTSERFSSLKAINTRTVGGLKVLCSYNTKEQSGFETGLLEVNGAIYGATYLDTFSIDPNTCKENWRVHEDFAAPGLKVDRGVAYIDGKVVRGTPDGQVIAYDAATGKRLWATRIADPKAGESVPASPIAWNGTVFVGNAGGDAKGVKGRTYALDAATGKVLWEFFNVPKAPTDVSYGPAAPNAPTDTAGSWNTEAGIPISGGATWTSYTLDPVKGLLYVPGGNPAPDFVNDVRGGANLFTGSVIVLDALTGAYQRHFQLVRHDFHDWDASTAPALFTTKGGKRLLAIAPKDGHLHVFDLASGRQLYKVPVTTIANITAPLTPEGTRFCPGTQGGAEWNGAAYDPAHDAILTGEVDWCTTVRTVGEDALKKTAPGQAWPGAANGFGTADDKSKWAGWLTSTDAATGKAKWRFKAPFPIMSGVTPTAGNVVFVGDMGGNFYAFNSLSGKKLWSQNLGGAVAGGVITYDTGAGQRVAVTAGLKSVIWPSPDVTDKVIVLGLQ